MVNLAAIDELRAEVREDAAQAEARARLCSRLEELVRQLDQLGFGRVTLERDATGMLVLSIDPSALTTTKAIPVDTRIHEEKR